MASRFVGLFRKATKAGNKSRGQQSVGEPERVGKEGAGAHGRQHPGFAPQTAEGQLNCDTSRWVVLARTMADSTTPLRNKLGYLIDEHKKAAAYCMTYNNLAAWLHTMIAASTVALSAAQQASSDRSLGIALIVLTAVTTTISFWQNICRFASGFAAHSTAISRYRTLLARTNNIVRVNSPEERERRLDELLIEKEEATRSSPSIPPWITGKLYGLKFSPWANVGVGLSICLLFLCSCLCGNPNTSEDAQVERAEAGAATNITGHTATENSPGHTASVCAV